MVAVLAVTQKGPRTERRYFCRISFQPSRNQSLQSAMPSTTSLQALARCRRPSSICSLDGLPSRLFSILSIIFGSHSRYHVSRSEVQVLEHFILVEKTQNIRLGRENQNI